MLKEKRILGKMIDFYLWEIICYGRGKNNLEIFRKEKGKVILLGIYYIFFIKSENFFFIVLEEKIKFNLVKVFCMKKKILCL